ncbi:MAG TPA: RNA polymerase sigma factor [Candidatus Limnocylindria bacterium]|nr:RNA polymerase sigma factor [Candidatus Limnocylindria bacterium]
MSELEQTWPDVLRRAAQGDAAAFGELVRQYDADLKRVCYVVTGDADSAQDAVQATWEIAWRKLRQIRDYGKIRRWLITVAVNEGRRIARSPRALPFSEDGVSSVMERDIDLGNSLRRLHVSDRQLLSLTFVAGLTSAEAAPILGLTPAGVRTRKARIVMRLRNELETNNDSVGRL